MIKYPLPPPPFPHQVARAAIGGAETGGGISITDADTSSHAQGEARQSRSPPGGNGNGLRVTNPAGRKEEGDDFSGEDAALVEAFATEIEEALGTVLEQVRGRINFGNIDLSECLTKNKKCCRGMVFSWGCGQDVRFL